MLRSCNSQMREHFKNWLIIKAGYLGGHNFGFLIDHDSELFRKRWIEFLQHPDTVLDPENLKFAYGGLSRQLKSSDNCELILTHKILSGFKSFLQSHNVDWQVFAILFNYRMQTEIPDVDPMLNAIANVPDMIDSFFHVAFTVSAPNHHVFLEPRIRETFRGKGCSYFQPLGHVAACGASFDKTSSLALAFQNATDLELSKFRFYHPELSHSRTPSLRSGQARGVVAAGSLLGLEHLKNGPYQATAQKSISMIGSLENTFKFIQDNWLTLHAEAVVRNINFIPDCNTRYNKMHKYFQESIADEFYFVSNEKIWFSGLLQEQIEKAFSSKPYVLDLAEVLAAEAFVTFLLVGGTLRLCYEGLKAAIGGTVTSATTKVVKKPGMLLPLVKAVDFRSISLGKFNAVTLANLLNQHLSLPQKAMIKVLQLILTLSDKLANHGLAEFDDDFNFIKESEVLIQLVLALEEERVSMPPKQHQRISGVSISSGKGDVFLVK